MLFDGEKTQGLKIHFPVIFKEQRTNPNVLRCLKYLSKKIAFTYACQGWTKEMKIYNKESDKKFFWNCWT